MILSDLPQFAQALEKFTEAVREMDDEIKQYQRCGMCPLDEDTARAIENARNMVENITRD